MAGIAGYELHAVETGRFALDGGAMFGVVPKTLWSRKIAPDSRNRISMAMRCLLMVGHEKVILVDNGLGDKFDQKFADIYAINQDHSTLTGSLNALGFTPEDVTDVILTHLHFDHCGGSTKHVDGGLELVFPNAVHHVQRRHWDWAAKPNPRERASFFSENLEPLEHSGQLAFLDGPGTFAEGIDVIVMDGHTRGQQLVRVADASHTVVFAADLLPTSAHIPVPWVMGYDIEPLKTMEEKATFLEQAATDNWTIFFEHDASVEIGRVLRSAGRYELTDERGLSEL